MSLISDLQQRIMRAIGRASVAHAAEGGFVDTQDVTIAPDEQQQRRPHARYNAYQSIVTELYRKYNGLSHLGSGMTRQLIDFRATQIAGNGFNLRSEHEPTNDFLQRYARYNQLSGQRGWTWVRDSELEGRAVLLNALVYTDEGPMVRARALPWYRWRYTVHGAEDDGETAERVTFTDAKGAVQELWADRMTYIKTAGASVVQGGYCLNDTPPRVGLCLEQIDAISLALEDLRGNNSLFGRPVRYAETADDATANVLRQALFGPDARQRTLMRLDGRLGEFYILAGRIAYAEPSGHANQSVLREITMHAQLISAQTGMPVHYMGFPELMSNRATADDMHELINATTAREREAWKSGVQEHASKAVRMYAEATGEDLEPDSVICSLPVVMLSSIDRVASVWLPLYQAGIVSKQTVREQIPGIDPEVEAQADAEAEQAKSEEAVRMADIMTRQLREVEDAPDTAL